MKSAGEIIYSTVNRVNSREGFVVYAVLLVLENNCYLIVVLLSSTTRRIWKGQWMNWTAAS